MRGYSYPVFGSVRVRLRSLRTGADFRFRRLWWIRRLRRLRWLRWLRLRRLWWLRLWRLRLRPSLLWRIRGLWVRWLWIRRLSCASPPPAWPRRLCFSVYASTRKIELRLCCLYLAISSSSPDLRSLHAAVSSSSAALRIRTRQAIQLESFDGTSLSRFYEADHASRITSAENE